MEPILVIVGVIAIIWFLYAHSPWGNLQRHLDGIEGIANNLYSEFIEGTEWSLNDYDKWDKDSFKAIGQTHKEMIATVLQHKRRVQDAKEMYFKLKEKTKYASEKVKIEVYQDWLDYMKAVDDMETPKIFREHGADYDIPVETFTESRAKMEMIEKRFNEKLKV